MDESTLPVTVHFDFVAGHIVVEATFADGGQTYQVGPVEDFYDPLPES